MGIDTYTAPAVGTPAGRLAAIQALALIQRLLALDDLWTALMDGAASGEDPSAVENLDVMDELVLEIREGLEAIGRRAYDVRTMLSSLDDGQFDQALDVISESLGVQTPDLRSILESTLPDYEPRGAAITACDYIRENWSSESSLMLEKLEALRRGETPGGDWRFPYKCAGFLMLVGAGVAGSIATGGAILGVGLTIGSSVGLGTYGWSSAGCPDVLGAIGGGRR